MIIIRNDDCLEGGLSMLLDTYPILKELKAKHPQHFATLTRVPATFIALHSGYVFLCTMHVTCKYAYDVLPDLVLQTCPTKSHTLLWNTIVMRYSIILS